MKLTQNPPYAPNLIESMRAIGYSFNTAISDIIDNSIAAKSKNVRIFSNVRESTEFIAVIDDGNGMDSNELFNAMKFGSENPNNYREATDMGRFGLGLKSASLSQCRKLTVISKKNNELSAYIWDLDLIIKEGNWVLQQLDIDEILKLEITERISDQESGTIVLWEEFDKIKETSVDLEEKLKELLLVASDHISLIYHRLLDKNFQIFINGFNVVPKDPFLEYHPGTQLKREQRINVDGDLIVVKPYILPHLSRLSKEDIRKVGSKESFRSEQGFYIYRNKRLIIWGTWFRLGVKNELFKLARVKVDFPNSMDYLWDIDIKKSRAVLPEKIKAYLYSAVLESCEISEKVHDYKGEKQINQDLEHVWSLTQLRRDEGVILELNFNFPLIQKFSEILDQSQKKLFMQVLRDIESSLPLDFIYKEVAKGFEIKKTLAEDEHDQIIDELKNRIDNWSIQGLTRDEIVNYFISTNRYVTNDKLLLSKIEKLKE